MNILLEIDGRWIQVLSKTIEINGKPVITQGDIKILNSINDDDNSKHMEYSYEHKTEYSKNAT